MQGDWQAEDANGFLYALERGFLAEVECSFAAWELHGKDTVKRYPITELRIVDKRPGAARLNRKLPWCWYNEVAGSVNAFDKGAIVPEPYYSRMEGDRGTAASIRLEYSDRQSALAHFNSTVLEMTRELAKSS